MIARIYKSETAQKGRHPALDAGSPCVDVGRRYRIGVRYDGMDNILAILRPFGQPPEVIPMVVGKVF